MFFSVELLGRSRPLGIVWLAGTLRRSKISRTLATSLHQLSFKDIENICSFILQPEAGVPLSLRTRGVLLAGVTQLFLFKVAVLEKDAISMLDRIQRKLSAPVRRNIDLDVDEIGCASSINLPAVSESHTIQSNAIDIEFLFSSQQDHFTHVTMTGSYQPLAALSRPQMFISDGHAPSENEDLVHSDMASDSPPYLSRTADFISRANRSLGRVDTTARAGHAELSNLLEDDVAPPEGSNSSREFPAIDIEDQDSDLNAQPDLPPAEATSLDDILLPPEPFNDSAFAMLPVDAENETPQAFEEDQGLPDFLKHEVTHVSEKHRRASRHVVDDNQLILEPERKVFNLVREKTTHKIRCETARSERAKSRFDSVFVLKSLRSSSGWTSALKPLVTALDSCSQRYDNAARHSNHAFPQYDAPMDEPREEYPMEQQMPVESNLDSIALDDIQMNNPLLSLIKRLSIMPQREGEERGLKVQSGAAEPADPPPDAEQLSNGADPYEPEPLPGDLSASTPDTDEIMADPETNTSRLETSRNVSFGFILAGLDVSIQKPVVARTFMQLLVLATRGQIKLRQVEPYQEIRVVI